MLKSNKHISRTNVKPPLSTSFVVFIRFIRGLKVIYHPLYSMNKCVTNKSKLPQDGAHVFPYMG